MEKRKTLIAVILISILGVCVLACVTMGLAFHFAPNLYQVSLESSSLAVGQPAPDFELPTLSGESVRLSQFKGQPVVLSIGASWCPDCRVEAPLLQELHETHPQLVILLVDARESTDVVQGFADEFGITHPILLDQSGEVMELYQIFAIPTELFIDADGVIRAKIIESVTPELLAAKLPLIGVTP